MTPSSQKCPACNNHAPLRLTKKTVQYFQCINCGTLFSGPLNNADMVGGGNEEQRNLMENHIRIDRIKSMYGADKQITILDYGCGHGLLVADLVKSGYKNAEGYDKFNPDFQVNKASGFSLVIMVEVIEHLSSPFKELDAIRKMLLPGGVIYIETSFVDIAEEEGIDLEEFFYIEPSVGHSTIFSHHGLDVLMATKGFSPLMHINRNVRLYQKP